MVKDVFDKARTFAPVALVLAGWSCFVGSFFTEETAIANFILLAAARVLP
jgi:uncharacterized membrane protein